MIFIYLVNRWDYDGIAMGLRWDCNGIAMELIDGTGNINFHSIVNLLIAPNKLQFTKFDKMIGRTVIPLIGNIEMFQFIR